MRWYWKTYVVETNPAADPNLTGPSSAFDSYNGNLTPAGPNEPSYPVFVDPIGANYQTSTGWVVGLGSQLPRLISSRL